MRWIDDVANKNKNNKGYFFNHYKELSQSNCSKSQRNSHSMEYYLVVTENFVCNYFLGKVFK